MTKLASMLFLVITLCAVQANSQTPDADATREAINKLPSIMLRAGTKAMPNEWSERYIRIWPNASSRLMLRAAAVLIK